MVLELTKYLVPLLIGVAGWFIAHLFANWRQSAATQSEHRWKLVTTYAEFINACSQSADRIYQWKLAARPWFGHYGTLPKEYHEAVSGPEDTYYLARSAADSYWTLLEVLEPYKPDGEQLLKALDAYERTNGSVEEKAKLKEFFKLRKELVNIVRQELVVTWRPISIQETFNNWLRQQKLKLKKKWEYFKGRFKRTKPTKEHSA